MKQEIPQQKRTDYFDIRTNGKTGRDTKAQKLVVIGNYHEYLAKQHRKVKITGRHGEL
jgi:hypothetical protein